MTLPSAPRLIDCREEDEWHCCRIDGAHLVPLSRFAQTMPAVLPDESEHVIVYCHHGMRSLQAVHYLRRAGFAQAQSMAGGIDAWSLTIDPAVPRY